ncbi:MAG: UbiD family decarboxylase [Nitrososphaerota archaeon]|nr:UbiD family decarboxylase [Nitrososphaerota archaeon]
MEQNKELKRETKEVTTKFEIAAIHMKTQGEKGPAILFENVKGYDIPVLVNVLSTRRRLALALNLPVDSEFEKINDALIQRVKEEIQPIVLPTGPCKEVIIDEKDIDLTKYPIVTMHEKDAGPYMTGGFVVVRDPETGKQNISFHRFLLKGKNKFGVLLEPRHLWHIHRISERMAKTLKIAIVLGYHPAIGIGGASGLPLKGREYELAGSLVGHPIQLVKAENSDLLVPADAEIVMEGEILLGAREIEAPYGEFTGYYGVRGMRPVVVIRKITQRKDPIYYSITARSAELGYYFIAKTVMTQERLKEEISGIKSANFLQTFFFVISLKKEREGDAKRAMLAAIAANDSIKVCIAVDDDINSRNPEEVIWAIATRCNPAKDTTIIPRVYGQMLDPSAEGEDENRVWSLLLIDATKPLGKSFAERSRIPSLEEIAQMKKDGKI